MRGSVAKRLRRDAEEATRGAKRYINGFGGGTVVADPKCTRGMFKQVKRLYKAGLYRPRTRKDQLEGFNG